MNRPPGRGYAPPQAFAFLSVSPLYEDHACLASIFRHANLAPGLQTACTVNAAMEVLGRRRVPVVIAERDLPPLTWRELLEEIQVLPAKPLLIVSSLHADEYLWAEALNLGVFDVLAKPFAGQEVIRVVSWAWLHWREANSSPAGVHGKLKLRPQRGDAEERRLARSQA